MMPSEFKIAIVGAGPAGYFTAQAFQNAQNEDLRFAIDVIERLPTPWGLVRSGVAPDHQKVKTVSKVFEKIARTEGFRLFANVELGKEISLKQLREKYDAVVLATGASQGRKLGIIGEELSNCISAGEFVPWYNAHPDFVDINIDLSCDTALIIGAGNVALDIARILTTDPAELAKTDIAEHALTELKQSKIKNVYICARRGPEHVAFTSQELRNLQKLSNTKIFIDNDQISNARNRISMLGEVDRDVINNLEIMGTIAQYNKGFNSRNLEIKFLLTPVEIKGNKRVEEIIFKANSIENGKICTTDKSISIHAGLVITAIGYDTAGLTGLKIENGRIANIAGHVGNNVYVTGWAKRGPVGVIGTNKSDSKEVVNLIISKLNEPKKTEDIAVLLKSGHKVIDQTAWEKIDASEVISGEIHGKPRLKEVNWNRLLSLGKT